MTATSAAAGLKTSTSAEHSHCGMDVTLAVESANGATSTAAADAMLGEAPSLLASDAQP